MTQGMPKLRIFSLAMFIFCLFLPSGYADNPMDKLSRGLINLVTSPGEYLVHTFKQHEKHFPARAFVQTAFYGTYYMLVRVAAGIYEIATFPIPLPGNYKSVIQPETLV